MTTFLRLRPGDVVLSSSTGFFADVNKALQTAYTRIPAEFTHVAICVVPDVLLDARPFEGIGLRNVFREVEAGRLRPADTGSRNLCVLRPPVATDGDRLVDLASGMTKPLYSHLGKKYNWLFTAPQPSDSNPLDREAGRLFCSELCSLILRHLSLVPVGWGAASATLPVHFQRLVVEGWQDVSGIWTGELRKVQAALADPDSETGRLNAPRIDMADRWIAETTGWAGLDRSTSEFDRDLDRLLARWKRGDTPQP